MKVAGTSKTVSLSTIVLALLLICAPELLVAQTASSFVSFNGPNAGTQTYQGTFPVAITNDGFIGMEVVDSNFVERGYVRSPKGAYMLIFPPTAVSAGIADLNSKGEVVGSFNDANKNGHGFFRSAAGKYTQLDAPGAISTGATSINSSGLVCGVYTVSGGVDQSFLWDPKNPTQYIEITAPNGLIANRINTRGEIAGIFFDSANQPHGFIRAANGTITSFEPGNGYQFYGAPAFNNLGQFVDNSSSDGQSEDLLRQPNGQIVYWGAGSHSGFQPMRMNDLAAVVGYAYGEGGNNVPFLWDQTNNITYLNLPFTNTGATATAINNVGQIVGDYTDANGVSHGWITH